jgi:hypothetical protein
MIAIRDVRRFVPRHTMATPMPTEKIKLRRLERAVAARLETRRLTK